MAAQGESKLGAVADEVQVLDSLFSPYCMRVKLALAAKGVTFSTIPTVANPKSPLLLQSNPVYKKLPVLLHHGKPICESLIICEYIDDAFPGDNAPQLLPKDPYLKAVARFWADFVEKKVWDSLFKLFGVPKEEFGGVIEEFKGHVRALEEGAFSGEAGKPFVGGEEVGYVDVVLGPLVVLLPTLQSLLSGRKEGEGLVEALPPRLQAWLKAFGDLAFVRSTLPSPAQLLDPFQRKREFYCPHDPTFLL